MAQEVRRRPPRRNKRSSGGLLQPVGASSMLDRTGLMSYGRIIQHFEALGYARSDVRCITLNVVPDEELTDEGTFLSRSSLPLGLTVHSLLCLAHRIRAKRQAREKRSPGSRTEIPHRETETCTQRGLGQFQDVLCASERHHISASLWRDPQNAGSQRVDQRPIGCTCHAGELWSDLRRLTRLASCEGRKAPRNDARLSWPIRGPGDVRFPMHHAQVCHHPSHRLAGRTVARLRPPGHCGSPTFE